MKKHPLLIIILSVVFILLACASPSSSSIASTLTPANEFTQSYESLRESLMDSLDEIALLNSPSLSSLLLKVGYISEQNIVIGIYEEGGTVVGWKPDTTEIAFTHKLGIVTSKGLTFISSGKNLVGATAHQFVSNANGLNQTIEYLNGIGVWNVRTGALIKCVTFPCQEEPVRGDGFLGLATDLKGQWISVFSESGFDISGLLDDASGLDYTINDPDAAYQWTIGSVAFDDRNRRYAVVFQEGRIYISDGEFSPNLRVLAKGRKNDYGAILDAQIDPTGHWLAVARDDKAQVINLDNGKVLLQLESTKPLLAFDQTGKLLFVGSTDRLVIYSLDQLSKISEYETPGITALSISDDNRLVIWGDVHGKIHVWGKLSPKP